MTLLRRAHGIATAWTTTGVFPFSTSATLGDACFLYALNTAAIGSAPSGWTEIASGSGGGYFLKIFRLNSDYPSSAPSQPSLAATGGAGGVGWIEHWYSDSAGKTLSSTAVVGSDTDATSTAFSATGSALTTAAGDVILAGVGIKTVSTMTGAPSGITLSQAGATLGTQIGNFGARLASSSPTNSIHYGTYHKPVTTGSSGAPTMVATAGTGGGNASGVTGFIKIAEVSSNVAPTANADVDQTVDSNVTVTLNDASTDSDGTVASRVWSQVSGPAVTLSSTTAKNPTFNSGTGPSVRVFQVLPTDNSGTPAATADTVTITTNAPAAGFLNHVVISGPRNGTASHTISPASGTVVGGSAFTPTIGRLLVAVFSGAVTAYGATPTDPPGGWNAPVGGSAVQNTGLYVWWKYATGSDSVVLTHNGSNYPVTVEFFEFNASSTFVKAASGTGILHNGSGSPTLSGLTGTNWIAGLTSVGIPTAVTPSGQFTWSAGVESYDGGNAGVPTDGNAYSSTYVEGSSLTSAQFTSVFSDPGGAAPSQERLMIAVSVNAGAPSNTAPNAGVDQTAVEPYSTVTISATDAESTVTWSQISVLEPQPVTLNGSGNTRTFIAPATRSGTVLTFRATDAGGLTDDMTVTVLPHNEWAVMGGVEVPMQVQAL